MASLATATDLEVRLGRVLTEAEAARADALLQDASALVRSYTRLDFAPPTSETVVLRASAGVVRLPKTPVTAVSEVKLVGVSGLPDITLAGWTWDGIDVVDVSGLERVIVNLPEAANELSGLPPTYRITYTHGYATVPADVVAVVCGMTLRTLTAPTMSGGVTSETIGSYSYRMADSGTGTAVTLTPSDRMVLDRYRIRTGTVTVRLR